MREEILETLLELLEIKSDTASSKEKIIEYTRKRLCEVGMDVTVIGDAEIPAISATAGEGGLVFSGHLDTVPAGSNWTRAQGEIDGDRIYGRGTADMKGAVAAMFHAAERLCEEEVPFSIFLTTDEEEGMFGAQRLAALPVLRKAKGMIIGEPTGLKVVTREKGVFRFMLRVDGKAAHSSQPWFGDNAIIRMHDMLSKLRDLAEPPLAPTEEMTLCVTTIRGGTKNNVVPEACKAEIDIRFPPSLSLQAVRRQIRDRLAGFEYEMGAIAELDAFTSPVDSPLGRELLRFLGNGTVSVCYATEAPRYARANKNIFICGPGLPETCHIADEWVSIGNLVRTYEMMIHMAKFAVQG